MRGLYAIVDVTSSAARGFEPLPLAAALLLARPAALQLRAKDLPPRETLALLRALVPMCRRAGVSCVANDRPDLAILAGCDYVHVGQTDIGVAHVRQLAPGMRIGVSTHDPAQLEQAIAARVDYVAYGPVFATTSKARADEVVGPDGLRFAAARVAGTGIPLVAIGGITLDRAASIAPLSDAAAVIAGLYVGATETSAGPAAYARVTVNARALHASLSRAARPAVGAEAP